MGEITRGNFEETRYQIEGFKASELMSSREGLNKIFVDIKYKIEFDIERHIFDDTFGKGPV